MQDGTTTTARGNRFTWTAIMLACALGAGQAKATPDTAQQELAGVARGTTGHNATLRQAMAEHPERAIPAIVFPEGSARLTPSATRLLDGLGRRLAGDRLRIEGHAHGDRDLADRRAKAVAVYLAQNCGVEPARVEVTVATRTDRLVLVVDLGE